MGTVGIPWDSHGNGSGNDYVVGTGSMGMEIELWERE